MCITGGATGQVVNYGDRYSDIVSVIRDLKGDQDYQVRSDDSLSSLGITGKVLEKFGVWHKRGELTLGTLEVLREIARNPRYHADVGADPKAFKKVRRMRTVRGALDFLTPSQLALIATHVEDEIRV